MDTHASRTSDEKGTLKNGTTTPCHQVLELSPGYAEVQPSLQELDMEKDFEYEDNESFYSLAGYCHNT